ncbi:MAG: ribosome silencing factor [FCB group bacterium]|nr:ribosome silencing factor [FCB group bacterium]
MNRYTITESKELAQRIAQLALEKKAFDVVSVNVSKMSSVTDYFIIVTGAVDVHLKAIADHIMDDLKSEKIRPLNIEGYDNLRWVLIDFVDVVVHLFLPDTRRFYSIEKLWGEAEITRHSTGEEE